ncbi:AraC family transcriptional regulator [Prauserella sp. PE36]|uniref:AraC family transcriptional regulator n=1 Tax=Prauserella endophytica TaxID=1592324 RepID=A0ABY2S5F8_9PSEU|nr:MULTISPECIES: AraC family transcriptional regulator [Prauserella]RBM18154.1 AraC family transcriptional regulator [Prauserella sp. PE36]TKG70451.1 AraC family transcriptional regulator [Prauserella endophytica]
MIGWDFPRGVTSAALLAEFAGELGVPRGEVLRGTGLDETIIHDPLAQVEAHQELAVVRNLIRRCPGRDVALLGLAAGQRYHATSYGIWGYAVTSSRTVRDAVELALRYIELTYVFCVPELRVDGESAHLHCRDDDVPADVRSFLLARDIAAIFTLVKEQVGAPLRAHRVALRLAEPPDAGPYRALLGLEPEFGHDHTRVSFGRALLDQPMPQANEHTAALCERQCRELLARRRARTGVARLVRDRLLAVDGLRADMEQVAAALAMTVRTLRRKLAAEGTTYRALLDEVREAYAEELLATQVLSVEQIAYRLGYSEASSFIHAFTRWKGVSPREFRRRNGSGSRPGAHSPADGGPPGSPAGRSD